MVTGQAMITEVLLVRTFSYVQTWFLASSAWLLLPPALKNGHTRLDLLDVRIPLRDLLLRWARLFDPGVLLARLGRLGCAKHLEAGRIQDLDLTIPVSYSEEGAISGPVDRSWIVGQLG